MRFKNTARNPLDFKLAGQRYTVPVGGEIALPDKFTDAVKSRGLPLEPIAGSEGEGAAPKPDRDAMPPEGTPARLWYDRAHQVMGMLEALQRQHAAVLDTASEERAETQAKIETLEQFQADTAKFLGDLRGKLKIGPEVSILGAVDTLQGEVAKATAALDAATRPAPAPKPPRGAPPVSPAAPPPTGPQST